MGAAVGLATGVLTGAGVGGGTLLLLYLTAAAGVGQSQAQGVNLLYFVAAAPPALISHWKNHRIAARAAVWAALSGCAAAAAGSLLSQAAGDALLRRLFGALIILIGLRELLSAGKSGKK